MIHCVKSLLEVQEHHPTKTTTIMFQERKAAIFKQQVSELEEEEGNEENEERTEAEVESFDDTWLY